MPQTPASHVSNLSVKYGRAGRKVSYQVKRAQALCISDTFMNTKMKL